MIATPPRHAADLTFWRNRRQALLERIVQLHNTAQPVPAAMADAFAIVGRLVQRLEAASR